MNTERLDSLDALRGLAALAVCWFHIVSGGKLLPDGLLAGASSYGHLGVAIFFVISGFVIPWSLRKETVDFAGYKRFLGKRMLRLHPPFLVASLIGIVLNWVSMKVPGYQGSLPDHYLPSAFTSFGFDMFYVTGLLGKDWTLVVAWTLALEVQFYLIGGLAALWLRPSSRQMGLVFWLLAACGTGFLLPESALVFRFLPLFVTGWAAAWMKLYPESRMAWGILLVSAVSTEHQHGGATAAAAIATFLVIRFLPSFSFPGLAWLGSISYSLYLVHVPIGGRIINLGQRWVTEGDGRLLLALAATAVSLLGAWLFFKVIEEPCHRWSRRIFQRESPVGGSLPAAPQN
jgi:peptidoglycan/LPS O-acetylase OafA/YrhL